MKDYYSIIGVQRKASQEEIKRAYRRLAVSYHPDKNPDPRAREIFVEINEAYDVVGDPEKRQRYDQRFEYGWNEVIVEQHTEQRPRHKDPAYHRSRPVNRPGQRPHSDAYYLMLDSMRYLKWAGRLGLIASLIFFLDYVLPYKIQEHPINSIYEVRATRNASSYYVLETAYGPKIKLYKGEAGVFLNEPTVVGAFTFFYSTPMWIANPERTKEFKLAYMYGGLMLFPLLLLITSVMALIFRERVEFCFNLNLVSGVLLLIFWFLV